MNNSQTIFLCHYASKEDKNNYNKSYYQKNKNYWVQWRQKQKVNATPSVKGLFGLTDEEKKEVERLAEEWVKKNKPEDTLSDQAKVDDWTVSQILTSDPSASAARKGWRKDSGQDFRNTPEWKKQVAEAEASKRRGQSAHGAMVNKSDFVMAWSGNKQLKIRRNNEEAKRSAKTGQSYTGAMLSKKELTEARKNNQEKIRSYRTGKQTVNPGEHPTKVGQIYNFVTNSVKEYGPMWKLGASGIVDKGKKIYNGIASKIRQFNTSGF